MTVIQITIPNAPRFRASVTLKNYPKLTDKFTKVSKAKPRKPTIKADKRTYPVSGRYMDTASYVKAFWELNFPVSTHYCNTFYQPLSKRAQEWPQEPLYEVIAEDEGLPSTIEFDAPESLPSWLTSGVPPAWLQRA